MSAYFDSFLTTRELQKNNIILKKRPKKVLTLEVVLREKTLIDVDEASLIIMSRYLFGFLIPFQ